MSLSIRFPFGWQMKKKATRVEVNNYIAGLPSLQLFTPDLLSLI